MAPARAKAVEIEGKLLDLFYSRKGFSKNYQDTQKIHDDKSYLGSDYELNMVMQLGEEIDDAKNVIDFLLEEYKQMGAAFFDLSSQKTQMFRFYLLLVTIPVSLIVGVLGLGIENSPLGSFVVSYVLPVFMIIIAVAGLLMTAIVVDIRFEAIMYAKTINVIRKYFKDIAAAHKLSKYFILPDSDDVPRFNEQPIDLFEWRFKWLLAVGSTFLEVVLMGIIDSLFAAMGAFLLLQSGFWQLVFLIVVIVGIFYFMAHILGYIYFANKRDTEWTKWRHTG